MGTNLLTLASDFPWESILGGMVLGALGVAFVSSRRLRQDLENLKIALHALLREQSLPRRLSFRTTLGTDLWHSFLALSSRLRKGAAESHNVDQVAELSSRLVGMADEIPSVAIEVVKLVMREARPDVIAAGVILRDPKSREIQIEYIEGIPRDRISNALLMYADYLLDQNGPEDWGYHQGKKGTVFDFSVFGVGMTLSVPLQNRQGVGGILWLALPERSSLLTAQRRAFVHAMAKHAAASFYAASRVREQSKKRDSEKDFLLGLSHDLRAPGNSALYALRDLLSGELGPLSSEQHLRLTIIECSLEEQLGILGDVLDYTKHQKGFLEARLQQSELKGIIEQTLEAGMLNAERKGLSFFVDSIPELKVEVDPRHLQRILANFLSNAVKYTAEGRLSVTFVKREQYLEIRVSDTGIGISEEEESLLFKEFSRLSAGKHREQGFGLGLALTKVLADLNSAYVKYERNQKLGSTFVVGIPIATRKRLEHPKRLPQLKSVVVVDDDSATCRANCRYLEGIAEQCHVALNLEQALAMVETHVPDLIITDLNLGDGSASNLLQTLDSKQLAIPVIVITGSGYAPDLERRREFQGAVVLEKPVNRSVLEGAVISLFNQTQSAVNA